MEHEMPARAPRTRHGKPITEALLDANRIAFGPLMFQVARTLWKRGVLAALERHAGERCELAQLEQDTGLSAYALRLLLDAACSLDLVQREAADYRLSKTGFVWLTDATVQVNAEFVHDLCYQAFFHFDEAIGSGRPAGLRVFGDWSTIYPALPELPEPARGSWYRFDHRYSDSAIAEALALLVQHDPVRVLDVGGNTGRFARALAEHLPAARVCMIDLPSQIEQARAAFVAAPLANPVEFLALDLLDEKAQIPGGFDAVWVSQLLDCFSEDQIVAILVRLRATLAPQGSLFVMEPCPDAQRFEAAAYSLNATSLYFACIANGNSRMYFASDWERMFGLAGLQVAERHDNLGICQSLFRCRPG